MTAIAKPSFAGTCEEPCSRNWWIEEYDDGKFRIMAGDNRAVMCRGDGYLSRKYAKRMGEWLVELAQKCSKHNDDLSGGSRYAPNAGWASPSRPAQQQHGETGEQRHGR